MKKLLIVFLVLAMASFASAAFTITIDVNSGSGPSPWDGSSDVNPSDVITVTVATTAGIIQMVTTRLNVSDGDGQANFQYYDPTNAWFLAGGSVSADGSGGVNADFDAGTFSQFPAGDIYSFDFHVPNTLEDSDYILIDPMAGGWNATAGQVDTLATIDTNGNGADGLPVIVLHVPEPMTIVLLGLGGLLLRRRRK